MRNGTKVAEVDLYLAVARRARKDADGVDFHTIGMTDGTQRVSVLDGPQETL